MQNNDLSASVYTLIFGFTCLAVGFAAIGFVAT